MDRYRAYETKKKELEALELSPEEYEDRIKRLARELGL